MFRSSAAQEVSQPSEFHDWSWRALKCAIWKRQPWDLTFSLPRLKHEVLRKAGRAFTCAESKTASRYIDSFEENEGTIEWQLITINKLSKGLLYMQNDIMLLSGISFCHPWTKQEISLSPTKRRLNLLCDTVGCESIPTPECRSDGGESKVSKKFV